MSGGVASGVVVAAITVVDLAAAVTEGEPVSAFIRRQPKPMTVGAACYLAYHLFAPERWRRWDPLGVAGSAVTEASRHFRSR